MKRNRTLIIYGILSISLLLISILASMTYGAKEVNYNDVWAALTETDNLTFAANVVRTRIPRTIFGILAGAALSISGALMQTITRNPIADPSILGVNTGASLFVVCGMAFFNISTGFEYMLLAFLGASITAVIVYCLASTGHSGVTPIKLALAGAATSTALQSLVNTVMLPNSHVMDKFRFWQTGSIGGATYKDIIMVLPWIVIGLVISVGIAQSLNTLMLGDDAAASLGLNVNLIRGLGAIAGVILCASTTALAGPIGFVGLMIPHLFRMLLGPDMKLIIPFSAVGGSVILLLSDVIGRILGRPGELESGIVTALIGAPVFVYIIRKVKVRAL